MRYPEDLLLFLIPPLVNYSMADKKERSLWRQLFDASQVGLQLVLSTFVGFLIGYGLDKLLGTSPYLTFIFLILGIVAGFREVFRFIKKGM